WKCTTTRLPRSPTAPPSSAPKPRARSSRTCSNSAKRSSQSDGNPPRRTADRRPRRRIRSRGTARPRARAAERLRRAADRARPAVDRRPLPLRRPADGHPRFPRRARRQSAHPLVRHPGTAGRRRVRVRRNAPERAPAKSPARHEPHRFLMTKTRTVLAVLVALFALLTLLDRFVLVELFVRRTGLPLLAACVEALAILAAGALARRAKTIDAPTDFLVGYPIFGTLCFLAGLVRINAWTMGALVLLGALASGRLIWRRPAATGDETSPAQPAWTPAFLAVAAILACGFVAAQAPPVSLDELVYHAAVPWQWTLEGRAAELSLNSHSYFPLGIESADLPLFAILGQLGGGIASHFLHLLAAIATIALIARRTQSWLATAAIATTPALAITAGWSLVDWPLAGLFVVLFVALESDDADTASAATAAGLLTKYTFLPFALVAWLLARKRPC